MTPRHSSGADWPERGGSAVVDATFDALSAAERDDSDAFDGFWTYDPETVAELDAYLERTYG